MAPKEGELPRDWHPLLDELHAALEAHIERTGESDNAIARATGISQPSISKFRRKLRGFSWANACIVAEHVGLALQFVKLPKKKS